MECNTDNNPNPNRKLKPNPNLPALPPVIFSSTEHPSQVNCAE